MKMSLPRLKRLLTDSEYQVVVQVVRARSLPEGDIVRLRGLVRGWRDKYVDRAHQQSREARGKGKPRSTRGAESNENTMRQADVMDWVLDRLAELEGNDPSAGTSGDALAGSTTRPLPSEDEVRKAIGEPHLSTFGDLWAEFPEVPVAELRKILWRLVEAGEVELSTAGGIELTREEDVAFVEEVEEIGGVSVERRAREQTIPRTHSDHFARTKVVRIRSHHRAKGARRQAKRDRGGGKRGR
jgi:hypothetical protein